MKQNKNKWYRSRMKVRWINIDDVTTQLLSSIKCQLKSENKTSISDLRKQTKKWQFIFSGSWYTNITLRFSSFWKTCLSLFGKLVTGSFFKAEGSIAWMSLLEPQTKIVLSSKRNFLFFSLWIFVSVCWERIGKWGIRLKELAVQKKSYQSKIPSVITSKIWLDCGSMFVLRTWLRKSTNPEKKTIIRKIKFSGIWYESEKRFLFWSEKISESGLK